MPDKGWFQMWIKDYEWWKTSLTCHRSWMSVLRRDPCPISLIWRDIFYIWYILNIFDISLPALGSKKFQKVQSLRGKSCYHAMHYRCVQMRFWKLKTFLKVENSFHDTESMTWLSKGEILFKINNQSSGWHLNECVTFI